MTGRNLNGVVDARLNQRVFSLQEGELPGLAQEQAESRGASKHRGITDSLIIGWRIFQQDCQVLTCLNSGR